MDGYGGFSRSLSMGAQSQSACTGGLQFGSVPQCATQPARSSGPLNGQIEAAKPVVSQHVTVGKSGTYFSCHAPHSTAGHPVLFPSPNLSSQISSPSTAPPSGTQWQHQGPRQLAWSTPSAPASSGTQWQHQIPHSVPWSVRVPPHFRIMGAQPACNMRFDTVDRARFGGSVKRKSNFETGNVSKVHISDEKMAARMRELRISSDICDRFPRATGPKQTGRSGISNTFDMADASKILQEIDDRLNVEDEEELDMDSPVLHIELPELRESLNQTWTETNMKLNAAPPTQKTQPCMEVVLWQQPSNLIDSILKEKTASKLQCYANSGCATQQTETLMQMSNNSQPEPGSAMDTVMSATNALTPADSPTPGNSVMPKDFFIEENKTPIFSVQQTQQATQVPSLLNNNDDDLDLMDLQDDDL